MTQELIPTNGAAQPAAAYLATQRNKATVTSELNKIARLMGAADWRAVNWATLNAANVAALFAQVQGAPATRNKTLSTLKGVARSAWRMGLIDSEQLERIRDIGGDGGTRELKGRSVEAWEIAALMRACATARAEPKQSPAAIRDAAIIAIAVKTGARRDELAGIRRADMVDEGDTITINVIGKRNKERVLYIDDGALKALRAWLSIAGDDEYLFRPISQIGEIRTGRMSNVSMHDILSKRAVQAGLVDISWHDFRRTFAGELLDAGEDISTVAQLMGHSSVNTTARYDRRPAATRRRAAKRISVPYF